MHAVVGSFRLQDERAKEEEIHKKAMAELAQPLEATPPEDQEMDYIAQVEHLQQLVWAKPWLNHKIWWDNFSTLSCI